MTASLLITLPMEEGTTLTVNSQSSHTITHNHAFHSQTSKALNKLVNILSLPPMSNPEGPIQVLLPE